MEAYLYLGVLILLVLGATKCLASLYFRTRERKQERARINQEVKDVLEEGNADIYVVEKDIKEKPRWINLEKVIRCIEEHPRMPEDPEMATIAKELKLHLEATRINNQLA